MPSPSPMLHIVATPLGNPGDLSPRARKTLESSDIILAEDTRRAARLCTALGIVHGRLVSFHEHNEAQRLESVLTLLRKGKRVALISDAGTPLLADPGFRLVRACRAEGIAVSPVPGPSAPVAALSAAGIAPLPYSFLGFLPRDTAGQEALFSAFAQTPGTLVFFDRKDRLAQSLRTAARILGSREVAVCRELTKIHEEFIFFRLENAADTHAGLPGELLGELTVLIGPPEGLARTPEAELRDMARASLEHNAKTREAAREICAMARGWSVKEVYALLLDMRRAAS